jgi:co-chaperonin GroES (HSP10)
MKCTIPYHDRVLVKLDEERLGGRTESGLYKVDPNNTKFSTEAIRGTCVRSGKRAHYVNPGDTVWLDKKTWNPEARYVLVREKGILAYEPATGEGDATATTGFGPTT